MSTILASVIMDMITKELVNPLSAVESFILNPYNIGTKGNYSKLRLHKRTDVNHPEYPCSVVFFKDMPCVSLPIEMLGMKEILIKWESTKHGLIEYSLEYKETYTKVNLDGSQELIEGDLRSLPTTLYFSIHPTNSKVLVINGVY